MGLKGMIVGPLITLLIGYAISNFPTSVISDIPFVKEDRFGLRTAVQDAGNHIKGCITELVNMGVKVKDYAILKVTGKSPKMKDKYGNKYEKPGKECKEAEKKDNEFKEGKRKRKEKYEKGKIKAPPTRLFTVDELKQYDGSNSELPIYISILGRVFDVTAGKKYYGPKGYYTIFAGKDPSRAFVSGNFKPEGLIDDISGLSPQDYIGLDEWLQFYRKDYIEVGKLIGRYFNENGDETDYWKKWQHWLSEARQHKRREDIDKEMFPPCNSEWRENIGGRVYCSRRSGGVERSWVGVPRQYFAQGKRRCACVRDRGPPSYGEDAGTDRGDLDHPQLMEYPDCPQYAEECKIQK